MKLTCCRRIAVSAGTWLLGIAPTFAQGTVTPGASQSASRFANPARSSWSMSQSNALQSVDLPPAGTIPNESLPAWLKQVDSYQPTGKTWLDWMSPERAQSSGQDPWSWENLVSQFFAEFDATPTHNTPATVAAIEEHAAFSAPVTLQPTLPNAPPAAPYHIASPWYASTSAAAPLFATPSSGSTQTNTPATQAYSTLSGSYTTTYSSLSAASGYSVATPVPRQNYLSVGAVTLAPVPRSPAAQVIDQQNTTTNNFEEMFPNFTLGQTFTPTAAAMNFVILQFQRTANIPFVVEVFRGAGSGGTLLGTSNQVTPNTFGAKNYEFDFASPIVLVSGQQYTLWAVDKGTNESVFGEVNDATGNPYAGGYEWGGDTIFTDNDLYFIEGLNTPVPEPSTYFAALLAGIATLFGITKSARRALRRRFSSAWAQSGR